MEPMSARAFLASQLHSSALGKLDALRVYEKSLNLAPGRYLTGFEVSRWMRRSCPGMKIENPSENDVAQMDRLWRDYEWQRMKSVSQLSIDQIHAWEEWALDHFTLEPAR